jgi:hypothetical protein
LEAFRQVLGPKQSAARFGAVLAWIESALLLLLRQASDKKRRQKEGKKRKKKQ